MEGNKAMKGERERSVKVDLEVIDETFATHHDNNDDHRNWFLFPWLASRPNLMKILRARDICQLNFQKRQKEQQTSSVSRVEIYHAWYYTIDHHAMLLC